MDRGALDQRVRQTGVVDIGGGHLGLPGKPAAFVHRQLRLVGEMGLFALHRDARVRIARVHPAASVGRTLDRCGDQGRVHEPRRAGR